ncbi:hypothetical protein F4825DRAFT_423651 [Nemania diffusa]|nr:hypothetical protein F4825DRAFT_423651 [Nemania diffusa]
MGSTPILTRFFFLNLFYLLTPARLLRHSSVGRSRLIQHGIYNFTRALVVVLAYISTLLASILGVYTYIHTDMRCIHALERSMEHASRCDVCIIYTRGI